MLQWVYLLYVRDVSVMCLLEIMPGYARNACSLQILKLCSLSCKFKRCLVLEN